MDKNHREQLVEDMKIELDDALYKAKTYRNLAERLQKEYVTKWKKKWKRLLIFGEISKFIKSSKNFAMCCSNQLNQLRACVQLICEHNF